MSRWLWLSAVVFALDQVSKYAAERWLRLGEPQAVVDGLFNLRLAYNPGVAFSFLGDAGGWQRWLFIAVALGISVWLTVWLHQLDGREKVTPAGLALLIGGAVGNVLDRMLPSRTMVVDFLDFYVGRHHWPTFNVADIAICCGAAALIYATLFEPGGRHGGKPSPR